MIWNVILAVLALLFAGCRTTAPAPASEESVVPEVALPATEPATPDEELPADEPISFRLTKNAAYRGDVLIYEDTEVYSEPDESGCQSSDSTEYGALSRVGPVFSYSSASSWEAACGYPSTSFDSDTIDLRDGQAAPIDLIVDPASILEALKQSSEFGVVVSDAATLEDALGLLRAREVWLTDYSFTEMSEDGTHVTMRLPYDDGEDEDRCLGCPDFTADLDLIVRPRPEFSEAFAAAADGTDGFLGNNIPEFDD